MKRSVVKHLRTSCNEWMMLLLCSFVCFFPCMICMLNFSCESNFIVVKQFLFYQNPWKASRFLYHFYSTTQPEFLKHVFSRETIHSTPILFLSPTTVTYPELSQAAKLQEFDDEKGITPLYVAATWGYPDLVNYLLQKKVWWGFSSTAACWPDSIESISSHFCVLENMYFETALNTWER